MLYIYVCVIYIHMLFLNGTRFLFLLNILEMFNWRKAQRKPHNVGFFFPLLSKRMGSLVTGPSYQPQWKVNNGARVLSGPQSSCLRHPGLPLHLKVGKWKTPSGRLSVREEKEREACSVLCTAFDLSASLLFTLLQATPPFGFSFCFWLWILVHAEMFVA